jgi:hypothetical protein
MSFLRGICFFDFLNYVGTVSATVAIVVAFADALKGHGFSRAAYGSTKIIGL